MADNTRKTSNIIHEVADLNSTVNNLAQNIENNTESIGNIKVYDSHIWLSTSKGLTVTQDGNTTTNNDQPTEWKLEADTDYLNTTLNFAKSDEIPSVYVKDIKSGDVTTLTVEEEDGVYTLTAIGGGGGGGIENITLAEGTCIKIDSEQYDDNGTTKTRLTINTDTDCLNTTLNFAKPTDIGDGNITLKSTDGSVSITGQNATANQSGDTSWDLSVNTSTPVEPGNGAINLTGGTGIDVTGANATANQTGDTSWSVAIDDTVALKADIPTIPEIPSVPDNIVETLNSLTGNLTLESPDKNIGIAENGTDKISLTLNASLDDLSNVSTGTPSNNQVLTWDGSNWTSQNASGGTFKTINGTSPDASGNFNIINGTGINATPGTNNLTLECTVSDTDTGIKTLKSGTDTVDGGENRIVEFTSSDASVQFNLNSTDNTIDLTVPAAGLDIRGTVNYRGPETSNGIYENGGDDYTVLWDADTYLDTATSGVANPSLGDMWIVQYEEQADGSTPPGETFYGHGYIFSVNPDPASDYIWQDAGRISGPPGEDGTSISLEENVTVNSNSTISSSTGEFVENASTPGEYALTLNIAPSDVNADCVESLNGMNEAINITSSDSFLNISNNDSVNPKTIDITLQSVANGGQNLALKTDIKDGNINMTASNGVKMSTGSANATANQDTNTEFKIEANYTEIAGNIAVGNLSNVCDTAPTDKQVLAWDNANSTWCPANATADAALPISDNRDPVTVTLDSPSANTFTVSTGGEERVKVDGNGRFLVGTNAGDNPNFDFHFRTANTNQLVLESDTGTPQLKVKAEDFCYYFSLDPTDDNFRLVSYNGANAESFNIFTAKPDGEIYFNQNVIVNGQVQTDTITSKDAAATDAAIELGATCNIDAAAGLVVKTAGHGNARLYIQDNYSQFNGRLWVAAGDAAAPGLTSSNAATGLCLGENNEDVISASIDGVQEMSLQANENAFINVATVRGSKDPDTDASIELGANFTVSTGNGGQIRLEPGLTSNNYLRVYDAGSSYGAMLCSRNSANTCFIVRPFKETVPGNYYRAYSVLWDYVAAERDFTNATKDFVLSAYDAISPTCKGDNYFAFNVGGLDNETDFTLAAAFHSNVAFHPAADKEAFNFHSTGTAPSRFESELQVPNVVGLAANDAAIELGANLTVSAGGVEVVRVSDQGVGIFRASGGYPLDTAVRNNLGVRLGVVSGVTNGLTIVDDVSDGWTFRMDNQVSNDGSSGFVFQDRKLGIGTFGKADELLHVVGNIKCDNGQIQTDTITTAAGAAGDAAIQLGAELLTTNHTPTQPNSIATKAYVDESFSGGGVDEDTVPGTGANFRWNEKVISVPYEINGTIQNNRQVFSQLYAYDGIFTDGLHWTPDGYTWHTSDQSLTAGLLAAAKVNDLGRVCKGKGNEYVTARYVSNDMKSWRPIGGVNGGTGVVYLAGEIYGSDGRYILNRTTNTWESTGTGFYDGGSLSSSPNPSVACQESGLYALTVSVTDGTVHWTAGVLDDFPSPYQQVPGITGGLSCLFSERLRKWMVATDDTLWITDGENLAVANWTSMALPTASNWDRMVDDGGTISIASTDDNANIVLYCQQENGPTSTADWETTTLYNNRGYEGFCGTNGRTIGSMKSEGLRTDPETGDRFSDYYYAISGDIRLENTTDTSQINLVSPTRDLRDLNPPSGLQTQADANQFMAAEIAKRAVVVTLTQDAYDAIPADEIDDSTLYLITG